MRAAAGDTLFVCVEVLVERLAVGNQSFDPARRAHDSFERPVSEVSEAVDSLTQVDESSLHRPDLVDDCRELLHAWAVTQGIKHAVSPAGQVHVEQHLAGVFRHRCQVLLVPFLSITELFGRPAALAVVLPVQELFTVSADAQAAPGAVSAGVISERCGHLEARALPEGDCHCVERGAQASRNTAHGADRLVASLHVTETSAELVVDVVVGVVRGQALLVVAEAEAGAEPRGSVVLRCAAGVVRAAVVQAADDGVESRRASNPGHGRAECRTQACGCGAGASGHGRRLRCCCSRA